MARVVILSINDNDVAESFVKNMFKYQEGGYDTITAEAMATGLSLMLLAHGKVEAMVARPTQPCRCKGWTKGEFERTQRFGWFVHNRVVDGRKCNKPDRRVVRNFIKNMVVASGNDLLPELRRALSDKEPQGPKKSGVEEVQLSHRVEPVPRWEGSPTVDIDRTAELENASGFSTAEQMRETGAPLAEQIAWAQNHIREHYGPSAEAMLQQEQQQSSEPSNQPDTSNQPEAFGEANQKWHRRSSSGKELYTIERRGSTYTCTCGDYVYRRSQRGEDCKHITSVKAEQE